MKSILIALALLSSSISFAGEKTPFHLLDLNGFGFAAPSVPGVSSVADKQVGMIIYDASSNQYKGLNALGNWDAFTSPVGSRSEIQVNTPSGYGSTNTNIRHYTVVGTNTGTAITYTPSTTLGDTFTINVSGTYAVSVLDENSGSSEATVGITRNSTQLTTPAISVSDGSYVCGLEGPNAGGSFATCSVTLNLNAGDVIRVQNGVTADGNLFRDYFRITQVGN